MVDLFRKELEQLINRHSAENESNTPAFIIAQHLIASLGAFDAAVNRREKWYDRPAKIDDVKARLVPKDSKKLTNKDISDFYRIGDAINM